MLQRDVVVEDVGAVEKTGAADECAKDIGVNEWSRAGRQDDSW